ncbi:MAG: hypothetical protein ACD_62C00288G0004 [uncultured bacterium]|nr:MAG: hypothetical protein ACD_62C00288G0004 [uncultured bacterium]
MDGKLCGEFKKSNYCPHVPIVLAIMLSLWSFHLHRYCTAPKVITGSEPLGSSFVSGVVHRAPVVGKDNYLAVPNESRQPLVGSHFADLRLPLIHAKTNGYREAIKMPTAEQELAKNERVKVLFNAISVAKKESELFIVGGGGGVQNGKIAGGLQILTRVEYD